MKIDIIGTGNVGSHLFNAFSKKGVDVNNVNSRSLDGLRTDSDLYVISVSDNAILDVARAISSRMPSNAILAHTSGTTDIAILKGLNANTGVFYPLQTFSKNVGLDYSEIPFFIEGSNGLTLNSLKGAASIISRVVVEMDSQQRRDLHVASVLSCNFVNHLWMLSEKYLAERNIDFSLLHPLIKETVRKIERTEPFRAQTGPAVRHDSVTIERHLEKLECDPEISAIYRLLSDSISRHHPIQFNQ